VTDDPQIAILDGADVSENRCPGTAEIIGLELDILGEPVNFSISVGKGQARLADIVPLSRVVCKKITDVVIERTRRYDGRIPCRPGCSACCYYLVPLSVPEAFKLVEEALAAPESRKKLMQRLWLLTARRILREKPPQVVTGSKPEIPPKNEAELNTVSEWYRNLKLACPFLHRGMCSIYEMRPLACREYFVNGSEKACRGRCEAATAVEIPVRMVEALGRLASELEGTNVEAVMLPLVLVWHADNLGRSKRTWPATEMVKRFFEIVKETAAKISAAVVTNSETGGQIDIIQYSGQTHESLSPKLKLSYQSHHNCLDSAVV
jgi:Fe-S-cluster containining protein